MATGATDDQADSFAPANFLLLDPTREVQTAVLFAALIKENTQAFPAGIKGMSGDLLQSAFFDDDMLDPGDFGEPRKVHGKTVAGPWERRFANGNEAPLHEITAVKVSTKFMVDIVNVIGYNSPPLVRPYLLHHFKNFASIPG